MNPLQKIRLRIIVLPFNKKMLQSYKIEDFTIKSLKQEILKDLSHHFSLKYLSVKSITTQTGYELIGNSLVGDMLNDMDKIYISCLDSSPGRKNETNEDEKETKKPRINENEKEVKKTNEDQNETNKIQNDENEISRIEIKVKTLAAQEAEDENSADCLETKKPKKVTNRSATAAKKVEKSDCKDKNSPKVDKNNTEPIEDVDHKKLLNTESKTPKKNTATTSKPVTRKKVVLEAPQELIPHKKKPKAKKNLNLFEEN